MEKVLLSEISDVTKLAGFEFTKYIKYIEDGDIIAIRALNLKDGTLVLDDVKRISKEVSESLERSQLRKNDIVISYTGTIGECAQITEDGKYHLAPNVAKITPKSNIDPDYLFQYIRSSMFRELMKSYCHGSTQPTIPMRTIRELPVYILPFDEQKKVASLLKSIDRKIDENKQINKNLEQQAQALFKSWFVDFEPFGGVMPEGWYSSTLGGVTEMGAGGDKPKIVSNTKNNECPYPIYSNGLDNEGLYGYTDKPKITDESVTVSARGTIGFVCLRHIPYVPIVRLVTLIPKTDIISAKYLYLFLKQIHISGTGTTQQQLTVPDFRKTEILVPDVATMSKFTEIATPMFERIWANQEENEQLSLLRDTLLPKLMSGELDVSSIDL